MLAFALVLQASAAVAQAPVRLARETRVYKAPGSQVLGTLFAGAEVMPGRVDGAAVELRLEGWIITSSLGPINRDGFNLAISERPAEKLRVAPNSTIIAQFITGTGFEKDEVKGGWTRVHRSVWVDRKALDQPVKPAVPVPVPTPTSRAPGQADRAEVILRAPLALAPDAAPVGTIDSGVAVRLLTRSGGWTRVQLEAWVPDSALATAPAGVLVGLSQAEVLANPTRYVGEVVQWRVQFIALQKADELRPEIPPGAMYLLTRGPLPEPGFVYVVLPPGQAPRFEAMPALRELVIRGTIRSATTKYLPTPVIELIRVVE